MVLREMTQVPELLPRSSMKKSSIKKSSIEKSSIEKSSIEKSKFESRESIKSAMLHKSLMSFFRDAASKKREKVGKIPMSRDPPHNTPQPPSLREFFRQNIVFCLKNLFLFKVKHVLAPQDNFAKLCKQTEKSGIWSDPPAPFWNFSHFFPFFSDRVPYKDMIS